MAGYASPLPDAWSEPVRPPGAWPLPVAAGAIGLGAIAVLGALAVILVGALAMFTAAVEEATTGLAGGVAAAPARQQAIDATLAEVGAPGRHTEIRREHGQLAIGTVVTYAPADEAAGTAGRTELLSAWIERSGVAFEATDVATFLDCAARVGAGPSRCRLAGERGVHSVGLTVATDVPSSTCVANPMASYRVEVYAGSVGHGEPMMLAC